MQAELVRAEHRRDRRVLLQRTVEQREITLEIDSLLEVADESGRETDQLHPARETLISNDVVLGQRRRVVGFIDAQFDLEFAAGFRLNLPNVIGQRDGLIDRSAVLHGGLLTGSLGELDGRAG